VAGNCISFLPLAGHGCEPITTGAVAPMWRHEQVDDRYGLGAFLTDAVSPPIHAVHGGFHLDENAAGGSPCPRKLLWLDAGSVRAPRPDPIVNGDDNLQLVPPEILQLFAQVQPLQW
jgi:hypothetical protein